MTAEELEGKDAAHVSGDGRDACPECGGVIGHAKGCPIPALIEEQGQRIRERADRMMRTVAKRLMQSTTIGHTPGLPDAVREITVVVAAELENMGLAFANALEEIRGVIDLSNARYIERHPPRAKQQEK